MYGAIFWTWYLMSLQQKTRAVMETPLNLKDWKKLDLWKRAMRSQEVKPNFCSDFPFLWCRSLNVVLILKVFRRNKRRSVISYSNRFCIRSHEKTYELAIPWRLGCKQLRKRTNRVSRVLGIHHQFVKIEIAPNWECVGKIFKSIAEVNFSLVFVEKCLSSYWNLWFLMANVGILRNLNNLFKACEALFLQDICKMRY